MVSYYCVDYYYVFVNEQINISGSGRLTWKKRISGK